MTTHTFSSCFAEKIEDFINMKRALRFKYEVECFYLRQIDRVATKLKLNSEGVTKNLADEISKKTPHETQANRFKRIEILRDFSSYLVDLEINSYVPHRPKTQNAKKFNPHIYSEQEISNILGATDNAILGYSRLSSPLFYFPVLLRLLIGTGVRRSEALNLKIADINFPDRTLIVRNTKTTKDRRVAFSESLSHVMKGHLEFRNSFTIPRHQSEFYFVTVEGKRNGKTVIDKHWKDVLQAAGIPFRGRSKTPRLHDFRHTFATRGHDKLLREGFDSDAASAIIAAALGHSSAKNTERDYLHNLNSRTESLMKGVEVLATKIYPNAKA